MSITTRSVEVAPTSGVDEVELRRIDHDDLLRSQNGRSDRIDDTVRRACVELTRDVDDDNSIGPGDPDPEDIFHVEHDAPTTCDARVDRLWVC
jgi:hypothetical protein